MLKVIKSFRVHVMNIIHCQCAVFIQYYFGTTIQCKILMAVNFMGFAVFLQNAKIITMKMNGQLVMWLNYACNQ